MVFTRRAVILKESRGQHPKPKITPLKIMTTFNTDYTTTELLDQELTIEELEAVAGGCTISVPETGKIYDDGEIWIPFA